MANSCFSLIFPVFCFFMIYVRAQPAPNGTDFSCSANSSSCSTYITYLVKEPGFLDLGNISGLFNVSRLSIAKASNLPSEYTQVFPGQLLLVPITCGCSGNHYFANISYEIKKGDSFYYVSITAFENLTNWRAVQAMNPGLDPINLMVGDNAVFPLFCKCPSRTQLDNQIQYLISYVWRKNDDMLSVGAKFNASVSDIVAENKYQDFSLEVGVPLMIPVSKFPLLKQIYPPRGRISEHPRVRTLIAVTTAACALFVLVFAAVLIYICRKAMNRRGGSVLVSTEMEMEKNGNLSPKMMQEKLVTDVSGCLSKGITYNAKELLEATGNFDEEHRIGRTLYRATFDEEKLAVKKTKDDVSEELRILHKVNHANLVKLKGIASDSDGNRFLVYEYAENSSLEKFLHQKTSVLSWKQRLSIALDVANGLQYLHEHVRPSIVHGNIRPSNILLDANFKAKIANFSTARAGMNGLMTKDDVFGFGMVLLELFAGKKDVRTGDGALGLAKGCIQEEALARPSMAEIVFNLSVLAQSSPEKALEESRSLEREPEGLVNAR